jgi:hypothetical protein
MVISNRVNRALRADPRIGTNTSVVDRWYYLP